VVAVQGGVGGGWSVLPAASKCNMCVYVCMCVCVRIHIDAERRKHVAAHHIHLPAQVALALNGN
jgi:chorismate mutase